MTMILTRDQIINFFRAGRSFLTRASADHVNLLVLIAIASVAETSSIHGIEIITAHNNGRVQCLFFEVPLNGNVAGPVFAGFPKFHELT